MNFNQLTILGFVGKNAETKQLPNGTDVTKFFVATTRSWKDEKRGMEKQNAVAQCRCLRTFAQITPRLTKGTHVFVQS